MRDQSNFDSQNNMQLNINSSFIFNCFKQPTTWWTCKLCWGNGSDAKSFTFGTQSLILGAQGCMTSLTSLFKIFKIFIISKAHLLHFSALQCLFLEKTRLRFSRIIFCQTWPKTTLIIFYDLRSTYFVM